MIKVITDKAGTGKNSFVPFVKVALKTGTAGKKKPYNAILTGFFPSNRPEFAFAFILEHSGPSKNKGAKFLKNFLIAFHKKGN
jgi:cell division protein FtsI/penicillin-binding protein 2